MDPIASELVHALNAERLAAAQQHRMASELRRASRSAAVRDRAHRGNRRLTLGKRRRCHCAQHLARRLLRQLLGIWRLPTD